MSQNAGVSDALVSNQDQDIYAINKYMQYKQVHRARYESRRQRGILCFYKQ
jgi:hypothetical protein